MTIVANDLIRILVKHDPGRRTFQSGSWLLRGMDWA
jgi:hypothetical protein